MATDLDEGRISLGLQDLRIFANSYPTQTLDLSRRELTQVPQDLPDCKDLENLYLEGNKLSTLPDSLFSSCSNLKWLDLRNNQLKVLPPSIEKLRSLRTLLLEGNQLVSLPPQLCRLTHLTGLNLSHNPLQHPPKEVTDRGTKAVLDYLREALNDKELSSSDSSSSLPDSGEGSSTYIPLKPITKPAKQDASGKMLAIGLPVPDMKPATLHAQASPVTHSKNKKSHSSSSKPTGPTTRRKKKTKLLQTHSKETKEEINKSLTKLKSKHGLEEWRNEAKLKQKQKEQMVREHGHQSYPKAIDTAPFATETKEGALTNDDAGDTLEGERSKLRALRYRISLEEMRKQAGIISKPSSQLQEAEKALAEALAMQEELERKKAKEYRLRAFTGDDLPY